MYVCMHVGLWVFMYVCLYVCMFVCIYVCICMYVCMYVRMYMYVYVCMASVGLDVSISELTCFKMKTVHCSARQCTPGRSHVLEGLTPKLNPKPVKVKMRVERQRGGIHKSRASAL